VSAEEPTNDTASASSPLGGDPPDVVPARLVNEVLYCERLAYLEWAQKEWASNHFTAEGDAVHERVDAGADPPLDPDDADTWRARSLWLTSDALGLTAKIDLVEARDGRVTPVEYKRGKRPPIPEGVHLPERAQVCAHVLLLREHGYRSEQGWVWFAGERRRVVVEVDDELEQTTRRAIARLREVTGSGRIPPPLEESPKCAGCSLVGICLPDEIHLLTTGGEPSKPLRRLHPARDDRVPLYVQEHGARIGVSKELLVVRSRDGEKVGEARMPNTSQVTVQGNVQVSTQAVSALLRRDIPLTYLSTGGWFIGRTVGEGTQNIELRHAQFMMASRPAFALRVARDLVEAKIANGRTLLRRNSTTPDDVALFELKQLATKARGAVRRESLLGIEGTAARVYFSHFGDMLKGEARSSGDFDWEARNRRPPTDPLNAMLSFAYALLVKDLVITLGNVGLDPLMGFYHQPRFGRPALALDLMEEMRPLIADSVVLSALNNGEVTLQDFQRSPIGCHLTPTGRRRMIRAYERRMDHQVTHPTFGYRISYRRVLEVQARLLGRHLLGELPAYPAFRTR